MGDVSDSVSCGGIISLRRRGRRYLERVCGVRLFKNGQVQPWWIAIAAVGGLLLAIILMGLAGLVVHQRIERVTNDALQFDVELDDHGDDLKAAVLDVRHFHRNIFFTGPSRDDIADFEDAYDQLHQEIDELEALGVRGLDITLPEELREMAGGYYAGFRPAVELRDSDPEAFEAASDRGLERIEEMESAAQQIDALGEERAADAAREVEGTLSTARLLLLAVIGGLILVGGALAYAVVRIIGEIQRLYAGEQAASEALSRASKAKTDFLADVSHEIRTPLAVLRGNAELGLDIRRDCEHEEVLEDIVKESVRMSRMVEDLLLLARSDAESMPLKLEVVPVPDFLGELAGRAEALARERGASFKAGLTGEGRLKIDSARVEQVVLVLVDNAAKYSPKGERVTLSSTTKPGELRIEVADRGSGIPEDDLPHIFDRFYRVDKMRERKQGGAGLGLSIARTIAEAHGGRLEAESRVGEGTRISLHLPLFSPSQQTGAPLGTLTPGGR